MCSLFLACHLAPDCAPGYGPWEHAIAVLFPGGGASRVSPRGNARSRPRGNIKHYMRLLLCSSRGRLRACPRGGDIMREGAPRLREVATAGCKVAPLGTRRGRLRASRPRGNVKTIYSNSQFTAPADVPCPRINRPCSLRRAHLGVGLVGSPGPGLSTPSGRDRVPAAQGTRSAHHA